MNDNYESTYIVESKVLDIPKQIHYKIHMLVIGYIRQKIINCHNLFIPIDITQLCIIWSEYLLFNTFEIVQKQKQIIEISGEIDKRTQCVETELSQAKPALEAAQKAVSYINKMQFNEQRALRNPPKMVDFTMRAVAVLMGKKIKTWKDVQKMLGKNDFIPSILKFNTNNISNKMRKKLNKEYLSNDEFTFERVNKASRVAGPLVKWVRSQVKFAYLLDSVEPMTKEIKELKAQLNVKQKQVQQLKTEITTLQNSVC